MAAAVSWPSEAITGVSPAPANPASRAIEGLSLPRGVADGMIGPNSRAGMRNASSSGLAQALVNGL
ncbi:MAG: hypothetical protein BWZ10_03457 [candidate division BRC1 bacterium ADurb.BinA364]|nr:MAG: hypothetical protein BWZ10_03457 [candidate division BRC1 bacterium ADurb.BinA364]